MKIIDIPRDDAFWKEVALPVLINFYHGIVLSELVERKGQHLIGDYRSWTLNDQTKRLYTREFLQPTDDWNAWNNQTKQLKKTCTAENKTSTADDRQDKQKPRKRKSKNPEIPSTSTKSENKEDDYDWRPYAKQRKFKK